MVSIAALWHPVCWREGGWSTGRREQVSSPASIRRLAMHHPYDDFAKNVGKGALSTSGPTTVEQAVARSAQRADIRHDPDPARGAERAQLGLLGRIAEVLCLIEVYGHAPSGGELRACLSKHFAHWEACARRAHAENS